jgi:guanosine-3',5'-bis(diphosphate) 3'-pyrophosphohydrolase
MNKSSPHRALEIVSIAFKDKKDLVGQPYIDHLIRIWRKLRDKGYNTDIQCIGILHDLLEDIPEWTVEKLCDCFNYRIVAGVVSMTHLEQDSYESYIEAVLKNKDSVIVKKEDLTDNMDLKRFQSLNEKSLERFNKYLKAYHKLSKIKN